MPGWKWLACGKHPLASDFFQVGHETTLGLSFCRWTQVGYERAVTKLGHSQSSHSWRFWARGNGRDELVLGLLRDSSDSRSRSFPLLMLGIGSLKNWTASWHRLPQACEIVWQSIEHISVARMTSTKEFERQLESIRPPRERELLIEPRGEQLDPILSTPENTAIARVSLSHESDPRSVLAYRIKTDSMEDEPSSLMAAAHRLLNDAMRGHMPQIVFMGGTPSTILLASFFRSLNSHDFLWMWSVSDLENS